jgi:hypothetical protein
MAGKESIVLVGPRRYFNVAHASDYTATTPSWIEDRLRSGVLPSMGRESACDLAPRSGHADDGFAGRERAVRCACVSEEDREGRVVV